MYAKCQQWATHFDRNSITGINICDSFTTYENIAISYTKLQSWYSEPINVVHADVREAN